MQLPPHLPAPYRVHERGTDQYGYVAFGGNYYWVPGKGRDDVSVIEYADRLKIYRDRELLVEYPLPPDGTRNACFRPEGQPKPRHEPHRSQDPTAEEEKRLRALDPVVAAYLDAAWTPKGAVPAPLPARALPAVRADDRRPCSSGPSSAR